MSEFPQIDESAGLELALTPREPPAADMGHFTLSVTNQSSMELTVALVAQDPARTCSLDLDRPQVSVPHGESVAVHLTVRPRPPAAGRQPRAHNFVVTASAAEIPYMRLRVEGQWQPAKRRLPRWAIAIPIAVALLAVVAVFFLAIWPQFPAAAPPDERTPTAALPGVGTTLTSGVVIATAAPSPPPTTPPSPAPTPAPSPLVSPTPALQALLMARLEEYGQVRAQAETELNPELLPQVCVDPVLARNTASIEYWVQIGSYWETISATLEFLALTEVSAEQVQVSVLKTETKLYYPPGSDLPDDEVCLGPINSYRGCAYEVLYTLVLRDGAWYVSEGQVTAGRCGGQCWR